VGAAEATGAPKAVLTGAEPPKLKPAVVTGAPAVASGFTASAAAGAVLTPAEAERVELAGAAPPPPKPPKLPRAGAVLTAGAATVAPPPKAKAGDEALAAGALVAGVLLLAGAAVDPKPGVAFDESALLAAAAVDPAVAVAAGLVVVIPKLKAPGAGVVREGAARVVDAAAPKLKPPRDAVELASPPD